jgi:hypothetical protein
MIWMKLCGGIHRVKPESIIVATVLVGTALRVLNIPDHVRKAYKNRPGLFESSRDAAREV